MLDILTIFRDYCGTGLYPVLFLAALVYLLITEKRRNVRLILIESSLVITVLFFFPLFKVIMDKLDSGTYYRVLWLLPMTIVITYAGIKLFGRHYRIGFAVLAAVFILTGTNVYKNMYVTKAENRYNLPDSVIAICNEIMPGEDEERVWAVFPDELIHYVRQYSSRIQMPYGRDMLVKSWEWNWDTHPIYELMSAEQLDIPALKKLLNEYECHYLILNSSKPRSAEPEDHGLTKIAVIEAYEVYSNDDVPVWKKQVLE